MRHQVHHVRKPLHVHELGDVDGAWHADSPDIVPAQIQQHDVFGALLLAVFEFAFQRDVFGSRLPSWAGAGNWVGGNDAVFDLGYRFDGSADNLESVEVEVVHVRRRIAAP